MSLWVALVSPRSDHADCQWRRERRGAPIHEGMYRDHGDWQKLRALFHAAKAALRAARKEPACLWTTSWADRGAPPGVSSMIGTTRPSCIRCAAWRIGPPKIRSFTRT